MKKENKITKNVPIKKQRNTYSVKGQIRHDLDQNPNVWTNRILIGLPCTGLVRMEWVFGKYGQIIPTNWSQVEILQWMSTYAPLEYQLPDAENLIAKQVVEGDYEWFLSWEQDNIPPQDAFIRLNEYMTKGDIPIISGLYYTKSHPAEPILYRGRGNGAFRDFKLGDKVWVDGIPFGFTLIHGSIIKAMWNESEEYKVGDVVTRRVFSLPSFNGPTVGFDNRKIPARYSQTRGTTDLNFYSRIIKDDILNKAGWPKIAKMEYPFLVDTNIFVQHIDNQGRMYPLGGVPIENAPVKGVKAKEIK